MGIKTGHPQPPPRTVYGYSRMWRPSVRRGPLANHSGSMLPCAVVLTGVDRADMRCCIRWYFRTAYMACCDLPKAPSQGTSPSAAPARLAWLGRSPPPLPGPRGAKPSLTRGSNDASRLPRLGYSREFGYGEAVWRHCLKPSFSREAGGTGRRSVSSDTATESEPEGSLACALFWRSVPTRQVASG